MSRTHGHGRPPVGVIIEKGSHAYRVLNIREPLDTSYKFEVIAERLTGIEKGDHYSIRSNTIRPHWTYLDEHYTVCNQCGELPPCSGTKAERALQKSVEAMALPDGNCPACKEPITRRQKKHVFPGPNLLNPFGAHTVQFHQRGQCAASAASYEELWVNAEPGRERSLLTLKCSGNITVHHDGTAECHGRNDGTDCPSVYAWHRGTSACYAMNHGCGKQCSPKGHPGIRLHPDLTPDGQLKGMLP